MEKKMKKLIVSTKLCQKDSLEKLGCPFDSVQKSQIQGMIQYALAYRVLLNIAVYMLL